MLNPLPFRRPTGFLRDIGDIGFPSDRLQQNQQQSFGQYPASSRLTKGLANGDIPSVLSAFSSVMM
jgi:hypothetical protein